MRPPRLIVLDLDGTLLRSDRTISSVNITVLRKAALEHNIPVLFSSGRMCHCMLFVPHLIGIPAYLSGYNGGVCWSTEVHTCSQQRQELTWLSKGTDRQSLEIIQSAEQFQQTIENVHARSQLVFGGREQLWHWPLTAPTAQAVYDWCLAEDVVLNVYVADQVFCLAKYRSSPHVAKYSQQSGATYMFVESYEVLKHCQPTKLLIILETSNKREQIFEVMKNQRWGVDVHLVRTESLYIEVVAAHVNKALTMLDLSTKLGIGASEIFAMGDGENDVEMLQQAGHSIAVANAHQTARAAAKQVSTWSNEEDAVARCICEAFGWDFDAIYLESNNYLLPSPVEDSLRIH